MKIHYLILLLATAVLPKGLYASEDIEKIDNYLSYPLPKQEKWMFGERVTEINWVENEAYKDPSTIYQYQGLAYPKMPRVHSYDHSPQKTYIGVEISKESLQLLSKDLLNKIFKDVLEDNRSVFFVAQNQSEFDIDNELLFRPQYYVDNNIQPGTDSEHSVSVALFALDGSKINLESKLEGSFINTKVYTHPESENEPGLIASPPNLKINNFNSTIGAYFASLTFVNSDNPLLKRAALTFHYIPSLEQQKGKIFEEVNTLKDIIDAKDALKYLTYIAEKMESYQRLKASLPFDFNPELYAEEHPELEEERKKVNPDLDLPAYAEWQFALYGHKDNVRYFPQAFNPELYILLRPGLVNEWENRPASLQEFGLWDYAKWQYVHHGHKDGFQYVPEDFNPELYVQLRPGLVNEWENRPASLKNLDLFGYAKWQYAYHGFKDNVSYMPEDFDAQVYVNVNPGLVTEWEKRPEPLKDLDLLRYASWQYAHYGFKYGAAYKN